MVNPITLLGGTFNPPHRGHIDCALSVIAHLGIEKLGLMPCKLAPHKSVGISEHHRVAMVERVCEAYPQLYPELTELSLPSPSYTVNTLRHLRKTYRDAPILFVLGQDSLTQLESWYEWSVLTDFCHLVIMRRDSTQFSWPDSLASWLEERVSHDTETLFQRRAGSVYFVPTPLVSISSTALRNQLSSGQTAGLDKWLEPAVINYIKQHQLYTQSQ